MWGREGKREKEKLGRMDKEKHFRDQVGISICFIFYSCLLLFNLFLPWSTLKIADRGVRLLTFNELL